jgi:hypothetical protein
VASSSDRLRLAPDDHSDTRAADQSHPERQKAPLATEVAVPMLVASGRGARRHHTVATIEGASSMAKTTRASGKTDSGPQRSAVKITPAASAGPATSTFNPR